jgi:uncharacterized protein involved in exopolysaccharide biosynthesis
MSTTTNPSPAPSQLRHFSPYLLLWLLLSGAMWSCVGLFVGKTKPTYYSEWALNLPGTTPGVNINLPEIGQASSSSSSAFGGAANDPRANYEFLATSDEVIKEAAKIVRMKPEEFGEPRVKLVDNTTIMKLQVAGQTPMQAREKARALHQALLLRLTVLRMEEVGRRDEGTQNTLKAAQAKLRAAQQRLSEYKASSGLSFQGQVDNLSVNVEQLRRQRVEVTAQQRSVASKLAQLSDTLSVSPQEASEAFILRADQVFQQNFRDYSEASANLSVMLSKWGENHPTVEREKARLQSAQSALMARSSELLGHSVSQATLQQLQLGTGDQGAERAALFRDVVASEAEREGLQAQESAIAQEVSQLDGKLGVLAQRQSVLENLRREVQTAEAVFASTIAKLDLSKSDIFTAYPMVQLVAEPNLPKVSSLPDKSVVVMGAIAGTAFTGLGCLALAMKLRSRQGKRRDQAQESIPNHFPEPEWSPVPAQIVGEQPT